MWTALGSCGWKKPRHLNNKGHSRRKQEYVLNNSNKKKNGLVYWRCFKVGNCKRDCHVNLSNNGVENNRANRSGDGSKDHMKGGLFFTKLDNSNQNYVSLIRD